MRPRGRTGDDAELTVSNLSIAQCRHAIPMPLDQEVELDGQRPDID
jgi:hypothetical protein